MIQIFGTAKCKDTQKAQRFFKERRIPFHFNDLKIRSMAKGEIESVAQSVPLESLVDRESPVFRDLGLHVGSLYPEKILRLLQEHPLLTKTPVVRNGKKATLGEQPEIWKDWIESEKS